MLRIPQAHSDSNGDSKNYKTSLCTYYLKGPCKNGDNCQFAHGTSELRLDNLLFSSSTSLLPRNFSMVVAKTRSLKCH